MNLKNVDRRLLTILLIVFVQMLGAAMILPILPLYAKREFGLSDSVIPLLISAFFAAQFLAGPYLGQLSDRHGRLPVLILSQIGTAISFVMLALAPSAAILFVARLLDGITGGNIIVAQAYITDITPREKRTASLGYIFAVFGLGFIFGPALGGALSALFGPRIPYLIAAGAATLTVILTWRILDETVTGEQQAANRTGRRQSMSPVEVARNFPLVLVLVVGFVGQFALGLLQATFALYGEAVLFEGYDENSTNFGIGLLLAAVGVGQVLTQTILLPRFSKRLRDSVLVIVGNVIRTVGLFVFAVVASPWVAAGGSLLFAAGMGLMMPPLQSLATYTVPDEMRGGVLGFYQSSVSMATIISTAIAGVIFSLSPTMPFWIGVALSLAALIPAAVLFHRSPGQQMAPEKAGALAD